MTHIQPETANTLGQWAALIATPAIATFIGTVGTALGWEGTSVCVIVVNAVSTLVGALLGVSQATAKPEGE